MKIEEIIAKMKEDGKNDEEIKACLEEMKAEIETFLGQGKEDEPTPPAPAVDEDEAKMHEVFGV